MKKIFLFLVCSSFFCGKCEKEEIEVGQSNEYEDRVDIHLSNIKDPRVNAIKVTLKNLDGIQPQFNTIDVVEKKREEYSGFDNKKNDYIRRYFKNIAIAFTPPYDDEKLELSLGKKRIYEMKLYLNDKLFFTKKISFTPERYKEGPLLRSIHATHKTEVDDMKYVFSIKRHYYHFNSYSCKILITDSDIKKWFEK